MRTMIPSLMNKVPSFVHENYPKFADFVRDYLTWLEGDENFLGIINSWQNNLEPSLEVEPYIDAILTDMGFVSGQNLAIDKSLLLHLLRDFYMSRGNEASFRFLFRILFNSEVSIRYPREQMLIPSYASYGERHFIFTTALNSDSLNLSDITTEIRENGGTITGVVSQAIASIENIQIVHGAGTPFFKIEILEPSSNFTVGEATVIDFNTGRFSEIMTPSLKVAITSPGTGYLEGDQVHALGTSLQGEMVVSATAKGGVSGVSIIDGGTGHAVGDFIRAEASDDGFGFSAYVTEVDSSGAILQVKVSNKGYNYATLPRLITSTGKPATLIATSDDIGAILSIDVRNPYVDFTNPTITITSENGTGTVLEVASESIWQTKEWTDRRGVLAEAATLIDSDKVQQFSYQIVSPVSSSLYDDFVHEYLHPVGFVRSSSYEIVSNLGLNISAGTPSVGSTVPYSFSIAMPLAFISTAIFETTNALVTSDGIEIITNLSEPILTV